MDFGLARLTEASRLTKTDAAMGTVVYMSLEQAQGMEVDSRSDLWSMGCVLYEMISGQRPFQGQYDQALLYEIVHEEVAPLTSIRAGVPMELELLTSKCLAKDREDRYQSAKEIAVDLRMLAEKIRSDRSTILRTTNLTPGVPATMTTAQTLNPAESLPPGTVIVQQSSHRATQVLAAVATLVMLALAFVHFTQAPPEAPPTIVTRFSFGSRGPYSGTRLPGWQVHPVYRWDRQRKQSLAAITQRRVRA
jgi:serine/threonine protein kinase